MCSNIWIFKFEENWLEIDILRLEEAVWVETIIWALFGMEGLPSV